MAGGVGYGYENVRTPGGVKRAVNAAEAAVYYRDVIAQKTQEEIPR